MRKRLIFWGKKIEKTLKVRIVHNALSQFNTQRS